METARLASAARAAEARGDLATAITAVRAFAECDSNDLDRRAAHLWHLDLLARAGHLDELTIMARTDPHARRRLNRVLHHRGRAAALYRRAQEGDRLAYYLLVGLLYARGRHADARRLIAEIDPAGRFAADAAL